MELEEYKMSACNINSCIPRVLVTVDETSLAKLKAAS